MSQQLFAALCFSSRGSKIAESCPSVQPWNLEAFWGGGGVIGPM